MNEIVKKRVEILEALFKSARYDLDDIEKFELKKELFEDMQKSRIINSFLFNITKIQDNLGAKFFKEILLDLREIDNESIPMVDVIHTLEKLHIVENLEQWDTLREIRNELTHNYSVDFDERIENLKRAIWSFYELQKVFNQIKNYLQKRA
jgi:hypothetical protein